MLFPVPCHCPPVIATAIPCIFPTVHNDWSRLCHSMSFPTVYGAWSRLCHSMFCPTVYGAWNRLCQSMISPLFVVPGVASCHRDLHIYAHFPIFVARERIPQNSQTFPLGVAEPYGKFKLRVLGVSRSNVKHLAFKLIKWQLPFSRPQPNSFNVSLKLGAFR